MQYQYNNITLSLIQVLNNQGLGLECLTFSTIFQSYWWRKPKYPGKTTDLPQVTDKHLSHNLVSSTPCLSGIQTHKVSGEYYHTITTTTTPKHSIYIYSKTPLYWPSIHCQTRISPRISAVPFSVCSNNPVKMPNSHTAIRHSNWRSNGQFTVI